MFRASIKAWGISKNFPPTNSGNRFWIKERIETVGNLVSFASHLLWSYHTFQIFLENLWLHKRNDDNFRPSEEVNINVLLVLHEVFVSKYVLTCANLIFRRTVSEFVNSPPPRQRWYSWLSLFPHLHCRLHMFVDCIPSFHVAEEETSDQKANNHYSKSWQLFDHVFHRLLGCLTIEHISTGLHHIRRKCILYPVWYDKVCSIFDVAKNYLGTLSRTLL